MTAADLIRQLQTVPPDTIMFVWVDGERMPVATGAAVDHWDDSHADINVEVTKP